ncbi:sugar ABC transporter ATP-binding protein [Prosthecomicrobium pneumaticum]|uniref:ABC-type sugar transport system ATPase subunit n=1 Tax=Prosthecomicrobium pneumaticum TaxID=81895 RepID=A0A7W9FK90_9HYPH|nr:sugar ABC transporter ATP-binding protein [Prosthecomicrobium pneumaticum]MBB5752290.1 ABC-type sugar transport system ATPase subunit [Prosthecomicrobium pneumaticum]
MTALLSVRGIEKSFDRNRVLTGIDLDIAAGEVVALLGENGAGKSTFVNILSGALGRDAGRVVFAGAETVFSTTREAIDAGIIHIHQELSLIGSLSVMENLFIGDYRTGRSGIIDRKALAAASRPLLERVGAGHIDPRRTAGELSTAEQQLVEIAKALSRNARLLILDEPTASLTPHEAAALFAVVRELKSRGVAVIFISHRLEEVFQIADRVVVLRDGGVVSDRPVAATSREAIIADMTGRAFALGAMPPAIVPEGAPLRLAAEAIGDGAGIGPISFELRAGEILGVFGLVGAGRTELLEMLCGKRAIKSGAIRLASGAAPASPTAAWRSGLALLPEGRKTNGILPNLSVEENIVVARRQAGGGLVARGSERALADRLWRTLGIVAAGPGQPIRSLSGGNQQKALFARCLAADPSILLLDEPTHGVDVRTKGDIYRTVRDLAGEGLAVVFVSSELPEILALASTVMVLAHGRRTLYAPRAGLGENDVLSAAFVEAA